MVRIGKEINPGFTVWNLVRLTRFSVDHLLDLWSYRKVSRSLQWQLSVGYLTATLIHRRAGNHKYLGWNKRSSCVPFKFTEILSKPNGGSAGSNDPCPIPMTMTTQTQQYRRNYQTNRLWHKLDSTRARCLHLETRSLRQCLELRPGCGSSAVSSLPAVPDGSIDQKKLKKWFLLTGEVPDNSFFLTLEFGGSRDSAQELHFIVSHGENILSCDLIYCS